MPHRCLMHGLHHICPGYILKQIALCSSSVSSQHCFALIGAAGYIAPRHMTAIKDTGNTLVAAMAAVLMLLFAAM